jgi:hypothetical protein
MAARRGRASRTRAYPQRYRRRAGRRPRDHASFAANNRSDVRAAIATGRCDVRLSEGALVTFDDPTVEDIAQMNGLEVTGLADLRDPSAALACVCMCHTRRFGLPTADIHDEGRTCVCQLSDDERAVRRASLERWLTNVRESKEGRALAAALQAERAAALGRARQHGMQLTIECEFAPTILSGSYRGHQFLFRERHGEWWLHLNDADGPVLAESGSFEGLVEIVDLIWDHLDRHDRAVCDHEDATSVFCPDCGERIDPD